MPDVTLDLGNQYIGSAYSPQVAIIETATGHEIEFTFADSEHPGQTKTEGYEVPNYSDEEAAREAAEDARAAAESARAAAESSREAYEQQRKDRELDRVFNENARANAEELREDAEQARAAAETARASAEGSRASAEQARTSAESARASAEAGRATAESARVSAEQARATAESARAAAESARVTDEQARQTDTAAAITRADAATAAANTATSNAQAATTAAQAATGEAETATDAANAAAALATAAAETVTDAYFPDLTAGAAEGITDGGPTDTAAWTYRACPGTDGPATIESIHGRTVRWNQLADNGNFANGSYHWAARESTLTIADGVATATPTSAGTARGLQASSTMGTAAVGHKYLISTEFNTNEATNLHLSFSGASPVTVVVPSTGVWHKCRAIYVNNSETRVLPYLLTTANVTTSAQLKYRNVQIFDLTAMFGAGNEPSTVAEFEALYPEPYYSYDAGSLLSVQMEGIETVGFNQWDEEWEVGSIDITTGANTTNNTRIRSKNFIPVFPSTEYHITLPATATAWVLAFDADKGIIDGTGMTGGATSGKASAANTSHSEITTPSGCAYLRFFLADYGTTYNNDICINLSWSGYRNGEYEPYWSEQRTIPATDLRSAGTVYDEQTATERITRVGEVDLGTLDWASYSTPENHVFRTALTAWEDAPAAVGYAAYPDATCARYEGYCYDLISASTDTKFAFGSEYSRLVIVDTAYSTVADFKESLNGVMLHYALATPTTQAIDPPLNMTYRAAQGGTERILHTDPTAAPTLVVTYGSTADGIRDRALACIAHVENGKASANYGVGSYLIHAGQLCRVTTAIAAGEAITIGTNVTATTVMAELLTLTQ